ncbi:unnamed protein product [Ilex paraguariensis]|uniref:Uncharacterized protein n=1 Tax=Ilex paraguariensis TaxID=185542 RepID=A0ABC8TGI8_9AQUA
MDDRSPQIRSRHRRWIGFHDEDDLPNSPKVSGRVNLSDPDKVDDLGDVGNWIDNFSGVNVIKVQAVSTLASMFLPGLTVKPKRSWKRWARENVLGASGSIGEEPFAKVAKINPKKKAPHTPKPSVEVKRIKDPLIELQKTLA